MTSGHPGRKRPVAEGGTAGTGLIPEKALIMSGFGINSEMETQEALARAGRYRELAG